jgi:hypothetical protein
MGHERPPYWQDGLGGTDGAVRVLWASDEGGGHAYAHDHGEARATLQALPSVFLWVRHLSDDEVRQFVRELVDTTQDAVHLDVRANLHRVIVEWRATARILADRELTARLTRRLPDEDHGEVVAP